MDAGLYSDCSIAYNRHLKTLLTSATKNTIAALALLMVSEIAAQI
jgi:hypothetical protein